MVVAGCAVGGRVDGGWHDMISKQSAGVTFFVAWKIDKGLVEAVW